jgi:hypothetical protein
VKYQIVVFTHHLDEVKLLATLSIPTKNEYGMGGACVHTKESFTLGDAQKFRDKLLRAGAVAENVRVEYARPSPVNG